ncbi:MAG: hypothetical protein HFE73_01415 [Firmicutes bacterium]|nr:hypothetical protein [Bacillota bacterium]
MRSDKREEERRQRAANRGNKFYRIVSILYTLILLAFIGALVWIDVLPAKYLYGLIGILVLISLFIVPVMFSKYGIKKRKRIATFFAVILIAGFGVGTWYMADTIDFIEDITIAGKSIVPKENYVVVVKSDSAYTDIQGLSGKGVGTHIVSDTNYSKAKNVLQGEVNIEYRYLDTLENLFAGLHAGGAQTIDETTGISEFEEYEAVFLSEASYKLMQEQDESLATSTKVLYTVSVNIEKGGDSKAVNVTKEPFNVYISGLDFSGDISQNYHSDVNILVTVNPKTHQILMTSIPRDYYINLPSKNAMDKLTHSGLYGIQETTGAIEDMLGIDINYYVKVNYNTIVSLVDAIGGIDINSPYGFTTHKMQDLSGITFIEGPNHLDGRMALAYSRERASWADGDMRRNENQQIVLEAIIKKAVSSTAILTSYTSILDAVRGNMETNMTQEEMTSLIKMQIDEMSDWEITKVALKGKPNSLPCYALGNGYASVVDKDNERIIEAADLIIKTMGKDQ